MIVKKTIFYHSSRLKVKRRNFLFHGIMIVVASTAILIAMHHLPAITIAGVSLRGVDMLSQLRDTDDGTEVIDTASAPTTIKHAYVDSCPDGVKCIEDYSAANRGMKPLYMSLHKSQVLGRTVRIAVLGDSYIEGDILTGELREMLQDRFGGCGVGYVPMENESHGFRRTVMHKFNGWNQHNAVTPRHYNARNAIISGCYFVPYDQAYTELGGQRAYCSHLDTCQTASLLFRTLIDNTVTVTINGHTATEHRVEGSPALQQINVNGRIGRVRFSIASGGDSVMCYGATMDGIKGIVVDNYALRASSGEHLGSISEDMLRQFDRLRHYDLVILMYGLNVANVKQTNYTKYHDKMCIAIEHLKKSMPDTGFLLIGVGDREQNVDGVMRTMKGIKQLMAEQQRIAADEGIAFWNLYDAMGGSGSISKMVNSKPRMANLDYTHINHLGGRHLAKLLYDAIIAGYDNYLRRLRYENCEE